MLTHFSCAGDLSLSQILSLLYLPGVPLAFWTAHALPAWNNTCLCCFCTVMYRAHTHAYALYARSHNALVYSYIASRFLLFLLCHRFCYCKRALRMVPYLPRAYLFTTPCLGRFAAVGSLALPYR